MTPEAPQEYRLSEDPTELDLDRVHDWLCNDAYWALGRSRDVVVRSFAGSHPVGIYRGGRQVAVARIVSDGVTFGWLCDVYVAPAHRGCGLGRRLARWAASWAASRGVCRITLATDDAHEVYASAGFRPLDNPARWMEVRP
jgi:GNAT superfamily N-acetyltransferase